MGKRDRPEIRLLWANGLFQLANGLSGLFTNVYLWRLKPSLQTPAYYNLFIMLTVMVGMPLAGWLVKRKGAVVANVLGTSLYAGFYLTLLLLQERAILHLEALGIFMGMALTSYALAGHVLIYDITAPEGREQFYSRNGLVTSVAQLVAPLTAGWVVSAFPGLGGYRVIFIASFVLFTCSAVVSLRLHRRQPAEPYRLRTVMPDRHPAWRRLLWAHLVYGMRDGMTMFAVNLLVFLATGGERSVGNFAFVTAGAGIAAFWLAGRFMTTENRDRLFPYGAVAMGAATSLLGLGPTWGIMLTYGLLNAVANPIWNTAFSARSFDIIREASGDQNLRVEMIAAREVPLGIGRVIMLITFIQVTPHLSGTLALQVMLGVLGLTFPLVWWIMRPRTA